MRVKVQCHCGWRRELSGFYAGKRIRCADCEAVLDVPGNDPAGAYLYPPMINWPSGRYVKPQGDWVPVTQIGRERRAKTRRNEVRYFPVWWKTLLLVLACAGVVVLVLALTQCDTLQSGPPVDDQPGSTQEARPDEKPPETPQPDDDFETEQVDEF